MRFGEGHVGIDEGFRGLWDNHASIVHDRDLEVSSSNLPLYKDHFDISYVRFAGGHVCPDEGFVDVWDIHASVVHDGKFHLDTWLCTWIILTYHMQGLVEARWVQIRAL